MKVHKAVNLVAKAGRLLGHVNDTVKVATVEGTDGRCTIKFKTSSPQRRTRIERKRKHKIMGKRKKRKRRRKRRRKKKPNRREKIEQEQQQAEQLIEKGIGEITTCLIQLSDASSFWCGGCIAPSKDAPLKITKRDTTKKKQTQQRIRFGTLLQPDVSTILNKIAEPAPFGDLKTNTTVIDESVRKAWECQMPRYPDLLPKRLVDKLQEHVTDAFEKSALRMVPYKLNVYCEGGFFKPHVDTPVNPKWCACLPPSREESLW